jgi:hypothetical protein
MMKRFWLLVFILVSVTMVGSQNVKHAPTAEQCRADQRLWLSKLEQVGVPDPIDYISFQELTEWLGEMGECKHVDPNHRNQYYNTEAEIESVRVIRLQTFLLLHGLMDKFYAEDAQGKRR